jgi:folylpolyglutamate synthase
VFHQDAIDALNSLQTPFSVIEARRKAGIYPDAASMAEFRAYVHRIGYGLSDLDRLNIVHVAGTKGKGSTCAFVDSILAQYRKSQGTPRKIGLMISPHLISVRERIRINSKPISEEMFAKYFFEIWDKLGAPMSTSTSSGATDPNAEATLHTDVATEPEAGSVPTYARYLALMSYHIFITEGVDLAIYETGIGGEFDVTNVVERPVAAGISTLGIDHVLILGDTIKKIAWHKGGIMKTGSAAFTIEQLSEATEVLRRRAEEKDVDLKVLDIDPRLQGVKIRPDAKFQKKNASLAIALAESALKKVNPSFVRDSAALPREFIDGLEQVVWRGRCEVLEHDGVTWFVDGAHTAESLKMASKWFVDECASRGSAGPRALVFNQQGRSEALSFLDAIFATTKDANNKSFDHVVFCTNVTYAATGYKRDFVNHTYDSAAIQKMTVQRQFAEKWKLLDPNASVMVVPTIEEAIGYVRNLGMVLREGEKVKGFITGSLHLVGGALGILEDVDAL